MLLLPKLTVVIVVVVFSILPNNLTELLNCFCSGPTSDKSLGILFILSLNNTVKAVKFVSSVGNKPLSIPPATAVPEAVLIFPLCPG